MASEERIILEQCIKPLMGEAGFTKQGPTWHRNSVDAIEVLNIQGSQWSKSFHMNFGTYFKAIGNEERPKEYDCHTRQRLCGITDDPEECNNTLSFESSIRIEERIRRLKRFISQFAIPCYKGVQRLRGQDSSC